MILPGVPGNEKIYIFIKNYCRYLIDLLSFQTFAGKNLNNWKLKHSIMLAFDIFFYICFIHKT